MGNYFKNMLCEVKSDIIDGSLIEITGNNEALIQGTKGIIEYTDSLIRVNLKQKQLNIYGQKLSISCLSSDSLVIKGIIERMEWVG